MLSTHTILLYCFWSIFSFPTQTLKNANQLLTMQKPDQGAKTNYTNAIEAQIIT